MRGGTVWCLVLERGLHDGPSPTVVADPAQPTFALKEREVAEVFAVQPEQVERAEVRRQAPVEECVDFGRPSSRQTSSPSTTARRARIVRASSRHNGAPS